MHTPKIEISNLTKIYYHRIVDIVSNKQMAPLSLKPEDKLALSNINLIIQPGEIIGIIGANGAGKSTLLSIIVGIAKQTQGEVTITGKVTAVMTLGIGLREDLTGRENIYLDGDIQGKSKAEMDSLIDKIIDFAELGDFIDKPLKTYSTGMKSRLAFSMLVEIEPEILIIDEALSAGDVFFAEKASKRIREICQKGKIVILVSHSMTTIQTMCNRCLWMEKGRIIMDGNPESTTKAYLKKIKEEDDLGDTKCKKIEISNTTDTAAWVLSKVLLKKHNSDYPQKAFYTQDSFEIEATIENKKLCDATIDVKIERIDGIIMHHKKYSLIPPNSELPVTTLLFQLSLQSLVLNKGYYQVKIELLEQGRATNYFTRFFEVRNNQMPSGGAPLLHYPAEIVLIDETLIEEQE